MNRWAEFPYEDLRILKQLLDDYCERYEDTCEAEAFLADEIDDELSRRYD